MYHPPRDPDLQASSRKLCHDVNNLLAIMLTNVHLAIHEEALPPDLRDMLCDAYRAGLRAAALTQGLAQHEKVAASRDPVASPTPSALP